MAISRERVVAKPSVDGLVLHASQLLALITCILLHLIFNYQANAQTIPAGTLVDAQAIDSEMGIVCSAYIKKNRTTFFLSKAGGGKLFGKRYIDAAGLKLQIADAKKDIASMTPRAKRDKKIKKALKKAIALRDNLTTANKGLRTCKTNYSQHKEDSGVRFEHVKLTLQKKCLNCHGVLGWTNTEEFFRESGRIVPGNIEASPLYAFLNGNPEGYLPATMPKGGAALSPLDLMLISNWIADAQIPNFPNPGTPGATPTPGGAIGEGRDLYQLHCAACHGSIDQSAKAGRTFAQIKAAIAYGGIAQMHYLKNLTDDQIQKISLALENVHPVIEGTLVVSNVAAITEGGPTDGPIKSISFNITLTGKSSQPFTVGYVTSNGTALADSDYIFKAGSIQFAGTENESHVITIDILTDIFQEADETLFVDIGGVSYGGVNIATSSASGTIINDDFLNLNSPPLASSVLMSYNFNGNFKDSIGLSDATPQADAEISSNAKFGSGALALDSTADYLTIPGARFTGATDFTFASWVYWDNPSSTSSRIFDFGVSTSNYVFFSPRDITNRCRFELRGAGTTTFTLQCPVSVALPSNRWVHLITTFNASTDEMKIYFDGQLVASNNTATPNLSSINFGDNRIGRSRAISSTDFIGRIDEVLIWNAALTQTQVDATYALAGSSTFNSGVLVSRSDGTPVANGTVLDIGTTETGKSTSTTIFLKNNGSVGLTLFGQPTVELVGQDADKFSVDVQPMPWQTQLAQNLGTAFTISYSANLPGVKTATLLIDNSDLIDGGFAIGLKATATGAAIEESSDGQAAESPELIQGKALYAANCASCHGALSVSTKFGTNASTLIAALNPNTGVPQMGPIGAVLSSEDVAKIILALNTVAAPITQDLVTVETYIPNIGTATYVAETLKDIFLPPGDPSSYTSANQQVWAIISERILAKYTNGVPITWRVVHFSQRCQRFDDVCLDEQLDNLMRPIPNVPRAGLYKQACDLLTENNTAVANALAKVGLTTSSMVTPQAVEDIYQKLFNPERQLPQFIADIVSNFPNQAPGIDNTDKFRFILNQFCISGVLEPI